MMSSNLLILKAEQKWRKEIWQCSSFDNTVQINFFDHEAILEDQTKLLSFEYAV